VLGWTGTDNKMWAALSYDGKTFGAPQAIVHDSAQIGPYIGGPTFLGGDAVTRIDIAGCAQADQMINFGWSLAPPSIYEYFSTEFKSVDTVAIGLAPTGKTQIAYAGANDPDNNLTLYPDVESESIPPPVVYADHIIGGPTIATTTDGYACAFVNKEYLITLLYGLENADAGNVNRVVLQPSSWHAPAVATIGGVTYLAWIGTDQPGGGIPTGQLNFADMGSMQQVQCGLSAMMLKEGGPASSSLIQHFKNLRDQQLLQTHAGRTLSAWVDHHSAELTRLGDAHPELRREAWALMQRLASIHPESTVFGQEIHDAVALVARAEKVATPALRNTLVRLGRILPAFHGRTLKDGLAAARLD
jgi:hypothetical protein